MALRILAVDDFAAWRSFISSALERQLGLHTFLEASDGLDAIHLAAKSRPDVILLDIGLPTLDGIKAARRIRDLSPNSKILFLSEESSPDVAEAGLAAGAAGYLVKSDAGRELLVAVKAVSEGKRYISASLVGHVFFDVADTSDEQGFHELRIYSDDAAFLDGFTTFIASVLSAGNAVIVVASEDHRGGLLQKLRARGFDLDAIIKSGSYISADVGEFLSSFMVDNQPDADQLERLVRSFVAQASKAPNGATRSVLACGECAPQLWRQGKLDVALRVEKLTDTLSHQHGLRTLCGYISGGLPGQEDQQMFQAICSLHSMVTRYDQSTQLV